VILVGTGVAEDSLELRSAVLRAAQADSLIVAAATTTGTIGAQRTVTYPAAYPNVLPVTDTASGPQGTLSAPVLGAYSIGPSGDGHYRVDGPGVAAAYVAGAAALLRCYRPRLYWAQIRDRLLATAQPGPGGAAGAGVLDPYSAVADLAARRPVAPPEAAAVSIPGPAPADPAVRAAALAGSGLLATAAALAALAVGVRALRRRQRGPESSSAGPDQAV
jgi:membrane-anchored mycosin MYCP